MATVTYEVQYQMVSCATCQMQFMVPDHFVQKCREDGRDWYCPQGHISVFRDNELARTKKLLAQAQAEKVRLESYYASEKAHRHLVERQVAAAKGQLTKVKKRVANGVCPCCKRQFSDLHRHMTSQHPDYAKPLPEGKGSN
jgi:hypothetical protein